MGSFSFPKSERLSKRNSIQELFTKGSSFYLYPFKVLVQKSEDLSGKHQALFSVSKRNFKRAVDRNLIKRRIREAYRLNKALLPESPKLQMAYIYTPREILDFHTIQEKLIDSIKRLHQYAEKG
ncbi:MAG: ribonuclease P protein component [Cyclobacteriaceae bacterium]|nr:ribonuclease P protein component [Cyclobacteriaceae bacterium]UYN87300.1 MAG: ribonuclease P protein component [Cyclobacteriaceae bacterium]